MRTSHLLLGDRSVEQSQDHLSAGRPEAFLVPASSSGVATDAYVYVDAPSEARTLLVGLYGDVDGSPGPLLSSGSIRWPKAGAWNSAAIAHAPIVASGSYWLALLSTGGTLRYRGSSRCGPSETGAQDRQRRLPPSWRSAARGSLCSPAAFIAGDEPSSPASDVEPPATASPFSATLPSIADAEVTTQASSSQSTLVSAAPTGPEGSIPPTEEPAERPPEESPVPPEEPAERPPEVKCTDTLSSLSQVNADLKPGAVVCLEAGSYGQLALSASPASNATVTAAPGAHVVVHGVQIGGRRLTVSQLHSTAGIEVISAGGEDTIEHDDVTNPNGYGISVLCTQGCGSSDVISNITIAGNRVHETSATGEGDALRFDGWSHITVRENDIYDIRECPSDTCHTDTLQSYQAGIPTTGLKLERNYIHDCVDAQGFPFLKDGDISDVTIADNLAVRMSSDNQVTGMFVDDNSSGLTIVDNTYQDTSGSVVQSEGTASNPTATVDHNVFDSFNVPAGKYLLSEDYDIFTSNDQWSFGLGLHSLISAHPSFVDTAVDDYRLTSNPNHIGIDWSPASHQYGPVA